MTLISHCGAREVTWGDLEQISTPPATETWFPLSHSQVLGSVVQTLDAAGFGVQSMSLAVTPDDARFFGTLQLKAEILPGVGLAVGVRNSIDRSLPIGFCCGQWVLVCDYADLPVMRTGRCSHLQKQCSCVCSGRHN